MEDTAYFIAKDSYDEIKEMLSIAKDELDPKLKNNPKFMEVLMREVIYVYQKTMSKDFKISVSLNKDKITIMNFAPIIYGLDAITPKKTFFNLSFFLKGDSFVYEVNQGALFDASDLRKNDMKVNEVFKSKIETTYLTKYYTEDGIEYSFSTYSDCYFFPDSCDDIDLREKVMSSFHKPVFSEYKLAVIPKYILNAKIENIYRKLDTISIIHSNTCYATEKGYKDLRCSLFVSSSTFADKLVGSQLVAKTDDSISNMIKLNVVGNYAVDINEVYAKAKEEFKKGLEKSPLKERKNSLYNAILNKVL